MLIEFVVVYGLFLIVAFLDLLLIGFVPFNSLLLVGFLSPFRVCS